MADPYEFAESLDERTLAYVKERNGEFSSIYGGIGQGALERLHGFLQARRIRQSLISGGHIAILYREGDSYHVSLNGSTVYSTDKVISWISLATDGQRLAVFETSGSDLGVLKIIHGGKVVEEIKGNITQLIFTESSYLMAKSYIEGPPPDGGELNAHRVLLNGEIVFGTGWDSTRFINLHRSGEKIIAIAGDWNRSSIYFGDLTEPGKWEKLYDLETTAVPVGVVGGEVCYIKEDDNGILMLGERELTRFPAPVESCSLVHDGFLVTYLSEASLGASIYNFSGKLLRELPLDEHMGLMCADSDDSEALLVLHSFGIPFSLWKYSRSHLELLDEHRLLDVSVEDRWVQSTGTKIHYFLASPEQQGKKRALAYGYGGYRISLTPVYSPIFAALLSEGITISQANLRGGGEYGKEWHDSGILERKQNVFDDFISVISDLKRQGYSVVAKGESNGGLLVGAILTQRPDLLDGAVMGVPVLDMMRFHLMSVGKYWITEFGNPGDSKEAEFLRKYSPYHNISGRQYPKALIYSRWNDDRVHPAHAIKFHMRLREHSDQVFLRVNLTGGHSGITPMEELHEMSEIYSFITRCLDEAQ